MQIKILDIIENRLSQYPYIGKKLLGDLSPFYRYKIANYRIIYKILDEKIEIEIIKVAYRK